MTKNTASGFNEISFFLLSLLLLQQKARAFALGKFNQPCKIFMDGARDDM
jgi:hypothetical protein